ncbi:MAG: helix-turn-helix domain-containing protein [Rhodoblastus sp.]
MALSFLPKATVLLDEKTAAERLGISVYSLARIRKRGEIAYTEIGGRIRYPASAIPAFISSRTVPPCPTTNVLKSTGSGSPAIPTAPSGKPHGSTGMSGKHGAHLLAQAIFKKPKSA